MHHRKKLFQMLKRAPISGIIFIIIAIGISILSTYNILLQSSFTWGVTQYENIFGIVQTFFIVGIAVIISFLIPKKLGAVIFTLSILYLMFAGALYPTIICFIYMEIILFIGSILLPVALQQNVLYRFVAGIAILGAGMILISLLQHGRLVDIYILIALLFFGSIITAVIRKKRPQFLLEKCYKSLNRGFTKQTIIVIYVLTAIFLILFAKCIMAYDADSIWYGYRSKEVLLGPNSIFDNLNFSCFVFFYPKMAELLSLPLSILNETSLLNGINVCILLIVTIGIYKLTEQIGNVWTEKTRYIVTTAIVSIPAIANIAVTAKADILGCCLCLCAFSFFLEFLKTKKASSFMFTVLSIGMCTGTKITYFLWGGILTILIIKTMFRLFIKKEINFNTFMCKETRGIWGICGLGAFFTLGIHYRTLLLTGYPIYPSMVNFWVRLGFQPKNHMLSEWTPFTNISPDQWGLRFLNGLFDPERAISSRLIISWTGSFWIFLLFIAIVLTMHKKINIRKTGLIDKLDYKRIFLRDFIIVNTIVSIYFFCTMTLFDGNYIIFPIVGIIIISVNYILNLLNKKNTKCFIITILIFIGFQTIIMYFTHSSYYVGIYKLSVSQSKNQLKKTEIYINEIIQYNDIAKIASYATAYLIEERVLTCSELQWNFLPWRAENIDSVNNSYFSGRSFEHGYVDFKNYMLDAGIVAIAVANSDTSGLKEWANEFERDFGCINKIEESGDTLYHYKVK